MSKKIIGILLCTSFFLFISLLAGAQLHSYEVSKDPNNGEKVLKGLITRADISTDTSFKWFTENMKLGQANAMAVKAFSEHAHDFQIIVFAGTWCEDTQNILPGFFRLLDKSGYPDSSITLIGVDRNKTTLYNLDKAFNVTKVPTFIVMKDGKEIGRIEEYGKYGEPEKELAEIVNTIR